MNVNVVGMDEVSIDKARGKLGDYVNAAQNGTPVLITRDGHPAAMLVPLTRLSATDRRLIAQARELAGVWTTDSMRPLVGSAPEVSDDLVRVEALGVAKHLLGELAAIIARLDGHG